MGGGREERNRKGTRREARKNRGMHFLNSFSPLSRSLGQVMLPVELACLASGVLCVRGSQGAINGSYYDYI